MSRLEEEESIRLAKLRKLEEAGINPYPSKVQRTHTIHDCLHLFDELVKKKTTVALCGRLRSKRGHGGLNFAHLEDGTGRVQIAVKKDTFGEKLFALWNGAVDVGDFLEAQGKLFTTKTGEKTLEATSFRIIAKSLLPLPEKWHGVSDVEVRYRKRYLDLIMNEEVRNRFIIRSKIISAIREFLDHPDRGFIEVETPTLQSVYGGGFARPFETHHNALDTNFYLRISDEMYLKRLIVGGIEKVYEITKVFRNEGIDHDHNPEFTMFEAQIAYKDYMYGMDIIEELVERSAFKAIGTTDIKHGDTVISVKRPWRRMKLVHAVKEIGHIDVTRWKTVKQASEELRTHLKNPKKQAELKRMHTVGEIIAYAFEELVEEKLVQPTIIYDYPIEVSPLAKKSVDPRFAERFEAFALGSEISNNYSELNDPIDLEQRFIEEKKKETAGFEEAHQTDYDYLQAIKQGMPPTCGIALGIDRVIMLLTGTHSIKEVILFPTLKPQSLEH